MKVQLHRKQKAFEMPLLSRVQALTDVSTIYDLIPYTFGKPKLSIDNSGELKYPEFNVVREYETYSDVTSVAKDRLSADFLKKFSGFTGEDPEKKAKEVFYAAEERCRRSNHTIRRLRNGATAPKLNAILLMAQRKISYVLGRFDIDELQSKAYWGPGVTSSVKGSFTDSVNKFQARPDVNPNFAKTAAILISQCPSWAALLSDSEFGTWVTPVLNVIKGNSVTFVPKTALTHRSIAVEPHIDSYYQLGIGKMIRSRLKKRASIDLDDQSINQRLAKLGSIDGSLATIDLESASDTISKELVRDLLPEDWFNWLDMTRSKQGYFPDKKLHVYEKFSSMGNGFTFDLESLIFWALAVSVVESCGYNPFWVNVMGDDVIVPSRCYLRVTRIFALVGFKINSKKSFYTGPFRESCGTDYWNGLNVRPVYLKDIPTTPLHWLAVANSLRRLASLWLKDHGSNKCLKPAYDFAVSRVPLKFRNWIPDGYGDGGLISNWDQATPPVAGDGWEGFIFYHLTTVSDKREFSGRSLVTSGIHKPSQKGNRIPLRDRVSYKKVASIATQWDDLGGWV